MEINLQIIQRHLAASRSYLWEKDSSKGSLRGIRFYQADLPCVREYAYLLTSDDYKNIVTDSIDASTSFIVLCNDPIDHALIRGCYDALFIISDHNIVDLFNSIQQIFELYNNWERHLGDAILSQAEPAEILDISAKLLPDPIALFDTSFSLIGYGGQLPDKFDDPIWRTVVDENCASVKNLPKDFRLFYEKFTDSQMPVCYPEFGKKSDNRILMAHLTRGNCVFAILAMDELCNAFEQCDLVILDIIRKKLECSNKIFEAAGFSLEKGNAVFLDLLDGRNVSSLRMIHMMRSQGWQQCSRYIIMRITSPNSIDKFTDQNTSSFIRRLRKAQPGIMPYYHQGEIVALNECTDEYHSTADFSDSFIQLVETTGLHVGVSMPYKDLHNIYEAGIQAEMALACAGSGLIVSFDEIAISIVNERIRNEDRYEYYLHPAVLQLSEQKRFDLLDTMFWYLETGRQLSETARIMKIHRNTVSYRLGVIECKCNIDFRELSLRESWHIKLSCIINNTGYYFQQSIATVALQ